MSASPGMSMLLLAVGGDPADPGLPRPHGWIGTADDWARALGIAFALLSLFLVVVAWRRLRRRGLTPGSRELLLLPLVVLPSGLVFFGYSHGIEQSKTVASCGSCHVMTPYVNDLRDPASDSLAAVHFKNRYIQENHCYTCHTDYGMFGTIQAKLAGVGHVARYTTGSYTLPLKIAQPYSNLRCLACHAGSQKFGKSEGHPAEDMPKLLAGETSCLECHGPAHPEFTQEASR